MKKSVLLMAVSCVALSGCTTNLNVDKIDPADASMRDGIPYFLPFTQFDIGLSWVASCEDGVRNGQQTKLLNVKLKMSSKPKVLQDTSAGYVIDYDEMNSLFKTSAVKVEYYEDNWRLKSINASSEDKSVEIAQKAIGIAGKLAVAGIAGDGRQECSATLLQDLQGIAAYKPTLQTATADLEAKSKLLKLHQAKIQKMGATVDQGTLAELANLMGQVSAAQIAKNSAVAEMNRRLAKVTVKKSISWPNSSSETMRADPVEVDGSKVLSWYKNQPSTAASRADELKSYRAHIDLHSPAGWFAADGHGNTANAPRSAGIRYRIPLPAILRACMGITRDCSAPNPKAIARVNVLHENGVFFLPFESKAGTNAKLSATFAKNGTITSAGYENSNAAASQIVDLVDTAVDQAIGFESAVRAREIAEVNQKKELIEAEQALAALQSAQDSASDQTPADEAEELVEEANVVDLRATIIIEASDVLLD